MFLIGIVMLGMLLSIGAVSVWHQVTSLYETAAYCYQKEQRVKYAEGLLSYGASVYASDEQLREQVKKFGKHELFIEPPIALPGSRALLSYELVGTSELLIRVIVTLRDTQEVLVVRCPVQ